MEEDTQILDAIFNLSQKDLNIDSAKAYGIYKDEAGQMESRLIKHDPDIYDLLQDMYEDKSYSGYEYISLYTTGWAAPLDKNGEIDEAPSQHPKRRRVTLVICADVNAKAILGSVVDFEDHPDERVYDFNQATGSLADALSQIFED